MFGVEEELRELKSGKVIPSISRNTSNQHNKLSSQSLGQNTIPGKDRIMGLRVDPFQSLEGSSMLGKDMMQNNLYSS